LRHTQNIVTLLLLSDRTQRHTTKQTTNINPTKTRMKTQQQGAAFRLSKCVAAEGLQDFKDGGGA